MKNTKNLTILFLGVLFIYFLFSQFYLVSLGNLNTYLINPLFFISIAAVIKSLFSSTYKSKGVRKQIIHYVGITTLIYSMLYYISGIFLTYGNNPYASNFSGIIFNLYSIGLVVSLKEYIRYKLLNNVNKKELKIFFILIVIIFSIQDIALKSLFNNLNIYYAFKTLFMNVIPVVTKNILFTYLALYVDPIPAILYELINYALLWFPPILPNVPWVFFSVIDTIFPLMLYIYSKFYFETKLTQNYMKKKYALNPKGLILYTVCIMTIIWFNLGVFPIKPVGIASPSMSPKINVGDVVLIKKCTIDEIEVLDVIEYRRKDFTVIHRVVNKYEIDGKTFLITKGDNNNDEDSEAVTEDQIIGKSIGKIPYIALPTLVLNELREQPVNVDVELGK